VMNNAVIAQIGAPRELYDAPGDVFVADFIGEANLIACEVIRVEDGVAEVRIGDQIRSFPARGLGPGAAQIAVRPSRLRLTTPDVDGVIPGVLAKSTYVGSRMEYLVETELGEIFVTNEAVDEVVAAGAKVGVALGERGPVLIPDPM